MIWLSAAAFDDRVAGGGRLLADGHESRAARARAALRRTVSVRAELAESELLDALEDVERLLDHAEDEDICPATRTLLLALDDALQESAVQPAESPHGLQSLPVGP